MRISAFMCQRKHWYLQRFVFPEMDNFLCGSVWDIPYDLAPGMVICGWAESHRQKPKQVSHTLTTDRKPTQLHFSRDRFHERSQCFFFLFGWFFFLHFYAIVSIFFRKKVWYQVIANARKHLNWQPLKIREITLFVRLNS